MNKTPDTFEGDGDPQKRPDEDEITKEWSDEPPPDDKIKGFDTPVTTPAEHQGDARRITM